MCKGLKLMEAIWVPPSSGTNNFSKEDPTIKARLAKGGEKMTNLNNMKKYSSINAYVDAHLDRGIVTMSSIPNSIHKYIGVQSNQVLQIAQIILKQ